MKWNEIKEKINQLRLNFFYFDLDSANKLRFKYNDEDNNENEMIMMFHSQTWSEIKDKSKE